MTQIQMAFEIIANGVVLLLVIVSAWIVGGWFAKPGWIDDSQDCRGA